MRFRSKKYLQWVREQPCVVTGRRGPGVQSAHFRFPGCGAGIKPMDLFTYPLHWEAHDTYHRTGHPANDVQLRWVKQTVTRAFNQGILSGELTCEAETILALHDLWCEEMGEIAWEK
jgi:hypothetical protein